MPDLQRQTPSTIASTLICQNQTSLRRKLSVAYVCLTVRSTASTRAKVGAKWEDFGKWLVHVQRNVAGSCFINYRARRLFTLS